VPEGDGDPGRRGLAGLHDEDAAGETWFVRSSAWLPRSGDRRRPVANKISGRWLLSRELLITVRPDRLGVSDKATFRPPSGKRRPLRRSDPTIVQRAHRSADGTYRAVAGRAIPARCWRLPL
jgi:hypothetical protein